MRRMVLVAAFGAVALAAAPEPAAAAGLDLRAGAFFPRADSNIFADTQVVDAKVLSKAGEVARDLGPATPAPPGPPASATRERDWPSPRAAA